MKYDFQTVIDRTNTGAKKWNQMYEANPDIMEGTVPMSVADMEFKAAPEITQGLKDFLDISVLGYTVGYDNFYQSVIDWMERRHQWKIEKKWIVNTSGVVPALSIAIKVLTEPGDHVIAFTPVYGPFRTVTENNKRHFTAVPLINNDDRYQIDFEAFEAAAQVQESKLLLFCSPHNPIGRVWTEEELSRLLEIANRNNLYIVVDEIWNDIVFSGHKHHVLANLPDADLNRIITCTAPSKSFNIAGLPISSIIISNAEVRQKFADEVALSFCGAKNILSYKACELAYNESEGWLDELIELMDQHQHLVADFLQEQCPQLKPNINEGTYVQWVDCSELGMTSEELEQFCALKAQFVVSSGIMFGDEGDQFIRINLALPTHKLQENLHAFAGALSKCNKL